LKVKNAISFFLALVLVFALVPAAGIKANPGGAASPWAREGVAEAIKKGFVPAELQNNYTSVITRGEFCRMAIKWLEYACGKSIDAILAERGEIRDPGAFTDTSDPDILAAFALGVTSGVGGKKFNSGGEITREQAAVMIMNTVRVLESDTSAPPPSGFADLSAASGWARGAIDFVRARGIMQGTGNNNFNPQGLYTREQSIVTFNNIKPAAKIPVPPNMKAVKIPSNVSPRNTKNNYLTGWNVSVPGVQTVVDGSGNICVLDAENAVIYEYSPEFELLRTIAIKKEFAEIGAFAKDKNGNYYVFHAKSVAEGAFDEQNMALVKYSPQGDKSDEYRLAAQTTDERWAPGYSGVKVPFANGTCRMEISGNMIAVYFGRTQFRGKDGVNHQASYGFILDIDNFQRLSGENSLRMPSAGHSWNQFVLPVPGGFVFADHGDHGPRCFAFERVGSGQNSQNKSFGFKGGMNAASSVSYQHTFAEMGGLSKTGSGYIFLGAYEKNSVLQSAHNDSRNLFVLTMPENLSSVSDPIWLTDYTNKETENAAAPKIVNIGNGKHLVLWEKYNTVTRKSSVYMAIIDDGGNMAEPPKELPGIYLNGYDALRYSPKTGLVYWAIGDGDGIVLYSLDPK